MPIRILHVINHFAHGGIESTLFGILRTSDRGRFRHDVCCIGGEEGYLAAQARELGAEILLCRKSVNLPGFSARFEALAAGRGYDVVHSHVNSWSGPVLRGAERAGVPVRIAHIHSAAANLAGHGVAWNPAAASAARCVDWVGLRWITRHATHVLGVSETALDLHWPLWRGEPERFFIWAGGVDTALFRPRAERPAGDGRAPELIFVGSFNPDKNQAELLDVLAAVRKRVPDVVLTFIGDGVRRESVRTQAKAQGLGGAVTFRGLRPDVPRFLAAADVFVSTSNREGLPQAVLEAQACGLPVVASDLRAHREALAPELRDCLFPPHRIDLAADKVVALLTAPEHRRMAGDAGRRFILERFNQATNMSRLQQWYGSWAGEAAA